MTRTSENYKKELKSESFSGFDPRNWKLLDKTLMKGLMKYGAEAGRRKQQITRVLTIKTFPV